MLNLDYKITNSGVLINVHALCWSSNSSNIANLNELEERPRFNVSYNNKLSTVEEFITSLLVPSGKKFNLAPGKTFINALVYEDLVFEQENDKSISESRSLYECVTEGFDQSIEFSSDILKEKHYAHVVFPIMVNFESEEDRNSVIQENEYLSWILQNMLGWIKFSYENPPEGVDSYVLGLASNDKTPKRFRMLYRFAEILKDFSEGENIAHIPLKLLIIKKDDHFVLPFVSLSTYCNSLSHLETNKAIDGYLEYIRDYFYIGNALEIMSFAVSNVVGNMNWLRNSISDEDYKSIDTSLAVRPIERQLLWGERPPNLSKEDVLMTGDMMNNFASSHVMLRHPKVGEFALLSTWYDKDKNPLWKQMLYPTSHHGYQELFAITENLQRLISQGNSNHSFSDLLLYKSKSDQLASMLFNPPSSKQLN